MDLHQTSLATQSQIKNSFATVNVSQGFYTRGYHAVTNSKLGQVIMTSANTEHRVQYEDRFFVYLAALVKDWKT